MAILNSFVRGNPDAVFVRFYPYRTFDEIQENDGFYRGGAAAVADFFEAGKGSHQEILIKPNVTVGVSADLANDPEYHGGIVTNPRFVAGLLDGLYERGEESLTVVEGGGGQGIRNYVETGYVAMITELLGWEQERWPITRESRGARLQWITKRGFRHYREDEITWLPVPDGVVHQKIPVVTPFRRPGTVLLNVPTLKTHNLGVTTLACKAMQGCIASGYRHFCANLSAFDVGEFGGPEVMQHFHPDFRERVQEAGRRHRALGLPRWDDLPDPTYGVGRFECWAQRTADMLSAFRPYQEHFLLNVVEGIIGRDGTAFSQGKDVPLGFVVAGINPVHVDAVTSLLMGHDPQLIPYLVVAHERGLGENDPARIATYRMPERTPLSVEELKALAKPLPVILHGDPNLKLQFTREGLAQVEGVEPQRIQRRRRRQAR